jgi:coenzyme PQQ synthesis protein D (PqqD)
MKAQPLARQSSLIVKEVDDETLVYDLESDQAHCLNNTAAKVWKNCDGQTSVNEIAQRLGADAKTTVDENVVWLALDQLEKFKLLAAPVSKPEAFLSGISRRQVMRALGVAVIALPMITSIVVPVPSQAQSVQPVDTCCKDPKDCPNDCIPEIGTPCTLYPPNPQMSGKLCI